METPREKEAAEYLKKHKLIELMENLTKNPREFIVEQLEQLNKSKLGSLEDPCLFDDSNLDTVFGILDPTKQEHITYAQYKEALTTLGIRDINECPPGAENNKISRNTFKTEARKGLQRSSATYAESLT